MGTFLSMSGIVGKDKDAVAAVVGAYARSMRGTFEVRPGTTNDSGIGILTSSPTATTILYPDGFLAWDELSAFLSSELKCVVFSFHIHDGDFWMFTAFDGGQEVAWFNPVPDYWGEVDEEEREKWQGDAGMVASLVPGLSRESIDRYLVEWTEDVVDSGELAYDGDEFAYGVDWQVVDFMRRLGFTYPVDDAGAPVGETFYLVVKR